MRVKLGAFVRGSVCLSVPDAHAPEATRTPRDYAVPGTHGAKQSLGCNRHSGHANVVRGVATNLERLGPGGFQHTHRKRLPCSARAAESCGQQTPDHAPTGHDDIKVLTHTFISQ